MLNPVTAAFLGRPGIGELLVVLVIVLVIFGPKQLPKLAKTFGRTINGFKKGVTEGLEDEEEKKEATEEKPAPAAETKPEAETEEKE